MNTIRGKWRGTPYGAEEEKSYYPDESLRNKGKERTVYRFATRALTIAVMAETYASPICAYTCIRSAPRSEKLRAHGFPVWSCFFSQTESEEDGLSVGTRLLFLRSPCESTKAQVRAVKYVRMV